MKQGHYFYLTAIAAVLIIVVGGYVFLNLGTGDYKYRVVKDGIEFVSNDGIVSDLLTQIKTYPSITVSPRLVAQGPENSYMATSITLFNTVLTAKRKKVVIVARVLDSKGNILECQSNLGDPKVNRLLNATECGALINDATSARVFVELPDEKLNRPRVVLESGVIRIYPSSFESVSDVSFAVLNALYPDSAQIIASVNSYAQNI